MKDNFFFVGLLDYWLPYLICSLSNGDFTRRCLKLNSVKIPHHSPFHTHTSTHTHTDTLKRAFCRINFSATFLSPSSQPTPSLPLSLSSFSLILRNNKKTPLVHEATLSISLVPPPQTLALSFARSLWDVQRNAFMNGSSRFVVIYVHSSAFHTLHTSCRSPNRYTNNWIHRKENISVLAINNCSLSFWILVSVMKKF